MFKRIGFLVAVAGALFHPSVASSQEVFDLARSTALCPQMTTRVSLSDYTLDGTQIVNIYGVTFAGDVVEEKYINGRPYGCGYINQAGDGRKFVDLRASAGPNWGYINVFVIGEDGHLIQFQWTPSTNWGGGDITANTAGPLLDRFTHDRLTGDLMILGGYSSELRRNIEYVWSMRTNWYFRTR